MNTRLSRVPFESFASRTSLAVITVAVALTLAGCGKSGGDQKGGPGGPGGPGAGGPLPVTVVEAKTERLPITVETVGQSEGSKEIQVRARVSGILQKQHFTEGDRVKAGVPMYQIDPAPYQIALEQARAAEASAQASSEQAQREEKRLKPLADEQAVSRKDYDDATSTTKTSAAQLMARRADVHNAELNLGYTHVAAPISGITGRNVNSEGNLVTVNTDSALLTTIVQTDPIWVRFSVNEAEYNALRAKNGDSAKVELLQSDGKNYPDSGKLNFAASTVDRTLGTVQLRAEVPNATMRILPGQFVKTRLYIGELEGILIPQAAVVTTDQGKIVMLAGPDNKVTPRPIVADSWKGNQWVVTKGLNPGDKVIIDNLVKLRPGAPVSPHPPQAQQPANGGDASKGGEAPKSGGDAPKAGEGKQ